MSVSIRLKKYIIVYFEAQRKCTSFNTITSSLDGRCPSKDMPKLLSSVLLRPGTGWNLTTRRLDTSNIIF